MNLACEHDLMESIVNSEELSIFDKGSAVIDMVDYKWKAYAFKSHQLGCFFHIFYVLSLVVYINNTFLVDKPAKDDKKDDGGDKKLLLELDAAKEFKMPEASIPFMIIFCFCLLYPVLYDGTQMVKQGLDYLKDPWNYIDMIHISFGYLNIYF